MNAQERALIDGLFDRMGAVANAPRDGEAEALIARRVVEAPHAPYALAQTVLVQEHALQAANARIEELEAQINTQPPREEERSNSFLGGLFGGGRGTSVPSAGQRPAGASFDYPGQQQGFGQRQGVGQPQGFDQSNAAQPQAGAAPRQGFGGGGFLSSALTTAAGVAGGALLYDGIKSMVGGSSSPFGAGEAKADTAAADKSEAGSGWNPWGDAGKDDAGKTADSKDAAPKNDNAADTAANDQADPFPWEDNLAADDTETGFDGGLDGGYDDTGWA